MSNRNRNRNHNHNNNENNHVAGRVGLVAGLAGSFSLVLMRDDVSTLGFIVTLLVTLSGYSVYVLLGR